MRDESVVQVDNLHRHYGGTHALKGVTFRLPRGEVLGLLGPNGAGKTTTLRLLSGVLAPSSGNVFIFGKSMRSSPKACKARLGYLPENPPLYPELTVDEYLKYCSRLRRIPSVDIADCVEVAKTHCGLSQSGKRLISNLSKGYKQRVGIAQAIVHSPPLVILDEPTAGLDPNQIREIRALIAELRGRHSVILSTHILGEAQAICDRIQIIHNGTLVLNQTLKDIQGNREQYIRVGFTRPPNASTIKNLPTVEHVDALDYGYFKIRCRSRETLTEALLLETTRHKWGLVELTLEHDTLEELFARLTAGNSAHS